MLAIRPGHAVAFLSDGSSIALPRRLDLSRAADQETLRQAVAVVPELQTLVETQLDAYLSLFPEDHWREVFHGGMVRIPGTGQRASAYSLPLLLRAAGALCALSVYPGFDEFLRGFRNPPQVPSALFELEIASWCRTRELTVGLDFAPPVPRGSHTKRPEFLWRTEIGDLFCECKRAHEWEAAYAAAYERLRTCLDDAWAGHAWPADLRLDVWIRLAGPGLEDLLRHLVDTAATRPEPGRVPWNNDHRLSAIWRPRAELPPRLTDVMMGFRQDVSDVERPASPEHSPYFLAVDLARNRRAVTSKLMKEARDQLPTNKTSAVFVQVGGVDAAVEKVRELIKTQTYWHVPFVMIATERGMSMVTTRDRQPFGQNLTEERGKGWARAFLRWLRAPIRRGVAWCLGRVEPRTRADDAVNT